MTAQGFITLRGVAFRIPLTRDLGRLLLPEWELGQWASVQTESERQIVLRAETVR